MVRKDLFKPETVAEVRANKALESEYVGAILRLPYKLWFIRDEDEGGWSVVIEEFPGCLSEGDSLTEAYDMLMEAAEGWLLSSLDMGHEIPKPRIVADEFE